MKTISLLVFVAFCLSQPYLAGAATYYVSSSLGNDSNSGLSDTAAWQSMQKVNATAFTPGDTILLKRGDSWEYPIEIKYSGTPDMPITYASYGTGAKPVIDAKTGNGPGHWHASIWVNESDNIVIDSLEVTGQKRYGIRISACENLVIKNSYIHHILSEMWHCIVGGGKNILITNNEIAYCGLEGYYASGENIELSYNHIHHTDMVSATNNCHGGGDVIHLNCWTPGYYVHHNILDHSNTCGPKGAFISSHCTLACLDNEPRCIDDIAAQTSNGIFEYNTVISGPGDNFGYTNSGYGDIVRFNQFYFATENYPSADRAQFGLKSEHGVEFHHNTVDGYGTAISLGKDGGVFNIYNNLITNTRYTLWGSGSADTRTTTINVRNNIILGEFEQTRANPNQVFHYSHNVATNGFAGNSSASNATLIDEGFNLVYTPDELRLRDITNGDYHPLANSPLIHAGIDVGLPFAGPAPTIGVYDYLFPWQIFLPNYTGNANLE